MLKHQQKQVGFTIVELLIVIVVIAILASISVAAYTGVQNRAYAAKAAAAAKNYINIFQMYKLQEGEFPRTHQNSGICLGPPDDFPADGVFDEGVCSVWNGSLTHEVDENLADMLLPYAGNMPSTRMGTVSASQGLESWHSNVNYRSLIYQRIYWPEDQAYITYFLNGTHVCPQGETRSYQGITECRISLDGYSPDDSEWVWGYNGGEGF